MVPLAILVFRCIVVLPLAVTLFADVDGQGSTTSEPPAESESDPLSEAEQPSSGGAQRTDINLLGETAAESGESRRNENVQFNLRLPDIGHIESS